MLQLKLPVVDNNPPIKYMQQVGLGYECQDQGNRPLET